MTIDIEKAKKALANLEREKQEQEQRLLIASEAKRNLENNRTSKSFFHKN